MKVLERIDESVDAVEGMLAPSVRVRIVSAPWALAR